MSDVASRLETALEEWGGTKTELSARLNEAGVRGHTRNAINDYCNGNSQPSVTWTRVAATILGIRPEWLAFGTEPKRPSGGSGEEKPWRKQLEERSAWFRRLPFGAQYTFLDLVGLYELGHPYLPDERPDKPRMGPPSTDKIAERLTFILRLPLIAWGYEEPAHEYVPLEYWTQVMGGLRAGVDALMRGSDAESVTRFPPYVETFKQKYETPPENEPAKHQED